MIPSPWLEQREGAHGGDAKSLALEMHQHINKIRALRKMNTELPPVWDIMSRLRSSKSLSLYSLASAGPCHGPAGGMNSPVHVHWVTFAKSPSRRMLLPCSAAADQILPAEA